MRPWAAALVVLATVLATELLAHAVHRYLMHGWGWGWHRSHHEPRAGRFERNDLYAIGFAAVAAGLMAWGGAGRRAPYWMGVGMTVYGALYFVVHDWMTHQRWPWRRLPRSGYLKRLVQAHRLHHAVAGRDGGVSFGFLYAPPVRVLKAQLAAQGPVPRAARSAGAAPVAAPTLPDSRQPSQAGRRIEEPLP